MDADVKVLSNDVWTLYAEGEKQVKGQIKRTVLVTSLHGEIFECNKGNAYELSFSGLLQGTVEDSKIVFDKSTLRSENESCNPEKTIDITPVLFFENNQITAGDGENRYPLVEEAKAVQKNDSLNASGQWAWEQTTEENDLLRQEKETWTLSSNKRSNGTTFLKGTMVRNVSVTHRSDKKIYCSGSKSYSYQDSYEIEGTVRENKLVLVEVAHKATPHPCVGQERTLDQAEGALQKSTLKLQWRGKYMQTLTRID